MVTLRLASLSAAAFAASLLCKKTTNKKDPQS
jgi:hypothetical protein